MYLLLCVTDVSELLSEQGGSLMPGRERRIYIKNELGKKRADYSALQTNHSPNLYSRAHIFVFDQTCFMFLIIGQYVNV